MEDLNSFQIYLLFKKDPDPNGSTVEKYSCCVSRKGGPMELAQWQRESLLREEPTTE